MKSLKDISYALSLGHCITWTYNTKACGIDPYWQNYRYFYDMWCGDDLITLCDLKTLVNSALFGGKTIEQIIPDMVDYDEE